MNSQRTLVVMAAGMGSRYGGLKQLESFGPSGQTLLEYSLYDAMEAGFDRAVFVIRKAMTEDFEKQVLSRFQHLLPCSCVFQELDALPSGFEVPQGRTKPWGTAHAVLMAETAVDGAFCVINADDAYGRDAFKQVGKFLAAADNSKAEFALAGYQLGKTLSAHGHVARGICEVDLKHRLRAVTEHTHLSLSPSGTTALSRQPEGTEVELPLNAYASMNMWAFTPEIFKHLKQQFAQFLNLHGGDLKQECYLPFVVDQAVQTKQATVTVVPTTSDWFGVTYPQDAGAVKRALLLAVEQGDYPGRLWRNKPV